MASARLAHDLLAHPLQPPELLHPLRQRQRIHGCHLHRSIDPVRGLAAEEVEISARLLQPGVVPPPAQLVVDRFQGGPWCHDATIMPYAVHGLRHQRRPGNRRERIEAAVIAGGRHASGPHEAWIAADPFNGGYRGHGWPYGPDGVRGKGPGGWG